MPHFPLDRVSLTGPDNNTSIAELAGLSEAYPFVEWALLYVPHKEGAPRNPDASWRQAFFDAKLPGYSAVHLCGQLAFEQLLDGTLPREIMQADRFQLNINARKADFTHAQVLDVYNQALRLGPDVILQYHEGTKHVIEEFMAGLTSDQKDRVHILLDASKGTGLSPATWTIPKEVQDAGAFIGFAGGLGPDNIANAITEFEKFQIPYWPDMESGIRTNNEFDIQKAKQVLAAANKVRIG